MFNDLEKYVSGCYGGHFPSPTDTVTCSVRLPAYQVNQLDFIAQELGVSRQSLMAHLLASSQSQVVEMISDSIASHPDRGEQDADHFMECYVELAHEALSAEQAHF